MILGTLLALAAAGEFEVRPRELPWEDLSPAVFDRRWVLPEPRRAGGLDLLANMRQLSELRFDLVDASGRNYRCLGDLVGASKALGPGSLSSWLDALEGSDQAPFATVRGAIEELLRDEHLAGEDWEPARDHRADGLLLTAPWILRRENTEPWNKLQVRPELEQAAALIRADLATIKAVESDYGVYPANVGSDYEEIYPVDGSYFVGSDPQGRAFSTLKLRFECDLPFPFSSYRTRLNIFNGYDDEGLLRTDIYSTSSDFYWLAGRDVFLPVTDSEGEWVAWILVRHFGFDLDGVPDGARHRREALRGSLGNLKRNSERAFARRLAAGAEPVNEDFLHSVRVLGIR